MSTEPATKAEIDRVIGNLRTRKWRNESSGLHAIADCPVCGKQEKLYVNAETGMWDCKAGECQQSGAIWSLATAVGLRLREKNPAIRAGAALQKMPHRGRQRVREGVSKEKMQELTSALHNPEHQRGPEVLAYLHGRGLTDDTIARFQLCAVSMGDEPAVGIPYVEEGKTLFFKMRNLKPKEGRKFMRWPKGATSALFNGEQLKDAKRVVLVEGEFDAMALWQFGVPAVGSTSLGAKKEIPQEWVETLQHADEIVLWYDDDDAGHEAVSGLVSHLGSYRCKIVEMPDDLSDGVEKVTGIRPKDAADLMAAGVSAEAVQEILEAAKPISNTDWVKGRHYTELLKSEILKGNSSLGWSTGWKNLDARLRGWRPKETTYITGHTSHGKTSFKVAVAKKFVKTNNEPAAIVSLENGPLSIAKKLFQGEYGYPISSIDSDEKRERALKVLERFDEMPIYLWDMKGVYSFEKVREAFEYARWRLGCRFLMLDHIGFLSEINDADSRDEAKAISRITKAIQQMADDLDAHIVVICHVKGESKEQEIPGKDDIKGSSSIKQEADNILTVFRSIDITGAPVERKQQLTTSSRKKITVQLGGTTSLLYLSKARHDEAREGVCLMEFMPRNLEYMEKSLGEPRDDEPAADPSNVDREPEEQGTWFDS